MLLSASAGAVVPALVEPPGGGAERSALVVRPAAAAIVTKTSLHVSKRSAAIGQSVVVSVTVKASHHGGTPAGTVEITDNGQSFQGPVGALVLTLDAKGRASYTLGAGNLALFVGKQVLQAVFTSSNTLPNSTSSAKSVTIKVPRLKTAADGLRVAAVKHGRGKHIAAGQTATVLYTGLLAGNGTIFDYASAHGPDSPTLQFTVQSGQVIPGFDEGVLGMKVGETRTVVIPSALGYGSTGSGSIPADADLVFLVTLLSIA